MQLQVLTTAEKLAALAAFLVATLGIVSFVSHPTAYSRLGEAAGAGMIGLSALFGGLGPILSKQHDGYSKLRAGAFVFGGLLFYLGFGMQFIRGF
ncbi:MAG: hypothetical protein JSS26_20320 [Nitrospira sp.]|nr:hypothetical protein [Nitrospira sp.]